MTENTDARVTVTSDVEYEGKVRATDPDTSWDAAKKQTRSKTEQLQEDLYLILRTSGPMTDDELLEHYEKLRDLRPRRYRDVTPQSVRSRRSELRTAGRVKNSGEKRPSANGSPATVWQAVVKTEAGE